MPVNFHPKPGQVLICDFNTGFRPPEMVKKRPVVVISKCRSQLVTVVPISTVEPCPVEKWHHELQGLSLPVSLRRKRCWAKCDMVATVALWRLDRVCVGKHPTTGKRIYVSHVVCPQDFAAIRSAVLAGLGFTSP
ncbi:MAG: type II toxin-antitoxin system PemK/MazF family toxin [Pirellulales bacterium]|nr:type II toxin-antitoxin system PemK/MazF family toxin [Pirellulales bacterium]